MLDRALQVNQQDQLYYVGHLRGTMMGFAGFTTNKTLATKVKKFFALAPVATTKDMRQLFHYMSEFYKEIEVVDFEEGGERGRGGGSEQLYGEREESGGRRRGGCLLMCSALKFLIDSLPSSPPPPTHTHTHTHTQLLLDIFGHGEFFPNTELIKSLWKLCLHC